MHQVSTDEFCMLQSDLAFGLPGLLSPGGKGNLLFRNRKDPAVGNGNLVGITPKIFNGIAKPVKGFLDIRAPVFFIKTVFPLFPVIMVTQFFAGRRKNKGATFINGVKLCQVLPLEHIPENLCADKKVFRGLADFSILCKSAAGNNAVHMDMVIQFLVPSVKHLDDSGCCAEPLLIR